MKRTKFWSVSSIAFVTFFISILFSCDLLDAERELLGSDNTKDVAVTSDVSDKGVTYAEIYGFVNLNQIPYKTNCKFGIELSEFEDFDTLFSIKVYSKSLEGNSFFVKADFLSGNSLYYYRTFVQADGVYYYGDINSFKTDEFNNITKTGSSSKTDYTSAVIDCTADTAGLDWDNNFFIGVIYSEDKSHMVPDSLFLRNKDGKYKLQYGSRVLGFNYVIVPFDSINSQRHYRVYLNRLHPNKTYYYCSFTAAGSKLLFGTVKSFTTYSFTSAFQFSTSDPQSVYFTSATLAGKAELSSLIKDKHFRYYFRCSTSIDSLDIWPYQEFSALQISENSYTGVAVDLKEGHNYYYCLIARVYDEAGNYVQTFYSNPRSFTTKKSSDYLSVNNVSANAININSASLSGRSSLSSIYTSDNQINYSIAYSTSLYNLKRGDYSKVSATKNNNTLSATAANLMDGTTYYYCLVAQTVNETLMSPAKSFTTKTGKDYLTVNNATSLGISTAEISGSSKLAVFYDKVYSYRIAYSTSYEGLHDGWYNTVNAQYDSNNKTFSATLHNLKMGTTYYYMVIASTDYGNVFSEIKSFTTKTVTIQKSGYVDLGLSVKWAACNLGASIPEDYGNYYSWGETNTKTYYSSSNYNVSISLENISSTQYDAAKVKLGNPYRIPTRNQFQELINLCEWAEYVYNNTPGYVITRNGNAIFMPMAGYMGGSILYNGFYYWTGNQESNQYYDYEHDNYYTISSGNAYFATYGNVINTMNKYFGLPIRPVTSASN